MAFELTETEKKLGAIPGQMTEGGQALAGSERRVRALAADRPAYTSQYGPQGAVSQAPARQMEQADVRQQAITGAFKPDQQVSANVTKQFGPQGELLGYAGRGTGRPSLDQQERDKEMASRGMVRDPYGNWMPPGGWGGGEQPQQAIGGQPEAAPQINYEGGWTDYFKSIAPAVAASKGRRIAQEQAGQERLGAQRERGALSRVEREAELRRQAAGEEREYGRPEREARIGESQARSKLLGAQEEIAQLGSVDAREYAHLKAQVEDEALAKSNPALVQKSRERLKAIEEKATRQKIAIEAAKQKAIMGEDYADGGEVRGYADGGAIGRAQTQQLNPLVSQYGQYLQAAAQTGVAPVPFTQYINLLGSTRGAMNQTPTQFADGGDVSDLSRPLEGPGTGRSDSIPAVIDGEQPAALSRGEFVIPEHVVRKKGTEFFEKLIAQYSEGVPANG